MIEFSEITSSESRRSAPALHEALLERIGRTLRIRQATDDLVIVELDHGGSRIEESEMVSVEIQDVAGVLQGSYLADFLIPGANHRGPGSLAFSLAGLDGAKPLDIEGSEIQILELQTDSGKWKVIHQSPGWDGLVEAGEVSR